MRSADELTADLPEDILTMDSKGAPVSDALQHVADAQMHDGDRLMGVRLRALRKVRRMSIQDLSGISGLSTGMLSQIERGLSTPSIGSLRSVAASLQTPISWFFLPDAEEATPRYIVRRASQRGLRLSQNGLTKALLTPPESGALEAYEITLEPSGSSGDGSYPHNGVEKASFVLCGTLRLWLDCDVNMLREGDSFGFPSRLAHRFHNPGSEPTRLLWIVANQDGDTR